MLPLDLIGLIKCRDQNYSSWLPDVWRDSVGLRWSLVLELYYLMYINIGSLILEPNILVSNISLQDGLAILNSCLERRYIHHIIKDSEQEKVGTKGATLK